MARAWVEDRWVKDATVTMPDGTTQRLSPTPEQLRGAIKTLPDYFRTAKYGKGSRWAVRWYENRTDGQRKPRQLLYRRRSDAEAAAAELEDDIRSGRYLDPSHRDKAFAQVAEAWLLSKQRIKDSTWRRYRRELDNYVLPKWGNTAIGNITTEQIRVWVQELIGGKAPFEFSDSKHVNHSRTRPGKMKPSYVKHLVGATFGGVLRFCVESGWLGRNPFKGVELPRDEGNLEGDLPSLDYEELELLAADAQELTERLTVRWVSPQERCRRIPRSCDRRCSGW